MDDSVVESDIPQDRSEAAVLPGEDSQERLAHTQSVQGDSLPRSTEPPTEPENVWPPTNLGAGPKSFESAGPASSPEMLVITVSMRGGHRRCLAADKTKCAYAKYNPLFGREDGAVRVTHAPLSDSQGCHNLSVNRQIFKGDPLSLNEVAPVSQEVVTDSSNIDYNNAFHCNQEVDSFIYNTPARAEDSPVPILEAVPFPVRAEEFGDCSVAKGRRKKRRSIPAICNGCQKTFSHLGNRNLHIRLGRCRGSNANTVLFSCPGCGIRFKLLQHLSVHVQYTPECYSKFYKK